jgi:alcohol dehydrogenase (cytochrome c)
MATYVEAGHASDYVNLSDTVGKAPSVTKNLGYERILKAREAEPHNWITYYGGYDGQRYSLLDQINASNVNKLTPACSPARERTRWRRLRSSLTASCT